MYEKIYSEVKNNAQNSQIKKDHILLLIDCTLAQEEVVVKYILGHDIDRIVYVQSFVPIIGLKHRIFWVNEKGLNPDIGLEITYKDFKDGFWTPSENVKNLMESGEGALNEYLEFYLSKMKKIKIRTWPKLCPIIPEKIEEAIFRQVVQRCMPYVHFNLSWHPLSDYKTIFTPEIERGKTGGFICQRNEELLEAISEYNRVTVIGGDLVKATAEELEKMKINIERADL